MEELSDTFEELKLTNYKEQFYFLRCLLHRGARAYKNYYFITSPVGINYEECQEVLLKDFIRFCRDQWNYDNDEIAEEILNYVNETKNNYDLELTNYFDWLIFNKK